MKEEQKIRQSITEKAFPALADELRSYTKLGVLLSGGMDSEVVFRASVDVLGRNSTLALTARTPFMASHYLKKINQAVGELGTDHLIIDIDLLDKPEITANSPDRCYFCKRIIYTKLYMHAMQRGFAILADGTNLSDIDEIRPGLKAAAELSIRHPMLNAGMRRADIEELAVLLGIRDPKRPPDSCLATRLPADTKITREKLAFVQQIEDLARAEVKGRFRARTGDTAVIIEYQQIDSKLIEENKQNFRDTAEENGYTIAFQEISD